MRVSPTQANKHNEPGKLRSRKSKSPLLPVAEVIDYIPEAHESFSSLGSNISETALTKEKHRLVMHGPFEWECHPLYSAATMALISLSMLAANWFMLMMASIALMGIAVLVIPREEAELVRKFGVDYRDYRQRTGRLAPRRFR